MGSTLNFVSYSPAGDVFYNCRTNKILQIRNTTDYSLILERSYANYTIIGVSNVQFTNNLGD
jgi:hypothetical protein